MPVEKCQKIRDGMANTDTEVKTADTPASHGASPIWAPARFKATETSIPARHPNTARAAKLKKSFWGLCV